MEKGISVAGTDGVGTKDLNKYVVVFTCYSPLPWFWKEYKAVNLLNNNYGQT